MKKLMLCTYLVLAPLTASAQSINDDLYYLQQLSVVTYALTVRGVELDKKDCELIERFVTTTPTDFIVRCMSGFYRDCTEDLAYVDYRFRSGCLHS